MASSCGATRSGGAPVRPDEETECGAPKSKLVFGVETPDGCVGITGPEHGQQAGRILYAEIVRGGKRVEHAGVLLPRVFGIEDADLGFGRGANGAGRAAVEASQVVVAFPVFTVQSGGA